MVESTIPAALHTATEHHRAGRLPQAEAIYRQILALNPKDPDALHLLGVLATQVGHVEGIPLLRSAIAQRPQFPEAYSHLGSALHLRGELKEAITCYRTAIALLPDSPETWRNLGDALTLAGEPEEAARCCRHAIELQRGVPQSHNNLGDALREAGKVDEAIAEYRTAISIDPECAEAHGKLAHALLKRGDFGEGYREYEWRWKCESFRSPRLKFAQPQWDGTDLVGKTILLHAEQGLGDTIQQIRFAPIIASRGGRVVLACPPELSRLFERSAGLGLSQVISNFGDLKEPIDLHLPLMSLPLAMGIRSETDIPARVPYITATPRQLNGAALKVGLAWSGSSAHREDKRRSVPLQTLARLASEKITFFSLQVGPPAADLRVAPVGMDLVDCGSQIQDFADTAEFIAALDLVVCVDTAVAHLAGAMGTPVWVMLPFAADFRWMMDRETSPWYPTMRLFRQSSVRDWNEVVQRMKTAIQTLLATI
jgi:Flp pilus assembly protein TadD